MINAVVATALMAAASAQAAAYVNGDVIVGFSSGTGNDTIWNLGQVSALTLGETWNVGSGLGLTYGAVAVQPHFTQGQLWATVDGDPNFATEGYDPTAVVFNAGTGVATLAGNPALTVGLSRQVDSTAGNSWNMQAAQPLANASVTALESGLGFSPTVAVGDTAYFYDLNDTAGTVTADGFFTYDSTGGVLTYGPASVPEPGTGSLLALFGGLAFIFRRRFFQA